MQLSLPIGYTAMVSTYKNERSSHMSSYSNLFSTYTLGSIHLSNRVALAPMTRISATADGLATEKMSSYYTSFARGGFGLLITEGTYIDTKSSQAYLNQPGIATDEQAKSWEPIVKAVHAENSKIILQLQHAGALSQGNVYEERTVAPSAIQPLGEQLKFYNGDGPFKLPQELSIKEMHDIRLHFVEAAIRAKKVGMDGVELHGANGYLLDNFLTDYTNTRSDSYGGSVENRIQFLAEIIEAVKQAVGDFTVGIRISQSKGNDFTHKWANAEHDAKIIFERIAKAGADYIHTTEYTAWAPAFSTTTKSLAQLAKEFSGIPVIANGQLHDTAQAESMIQNGDADLVSLGKGALANHDWVIKTKTGASIHPFEPAKIFHPIANLKPYEYVN